LNGLFLTVSTGTCGSNCPGSHPYFDHFSMKCVTICPSYLIFNDPHCNICGAGTYNYLGNCQANCNNIPYFPNSTVWACISCHETCYRCNGEYA
jgi:hypothetical protein